MEWRHWWTGKGCWMSSSWTSAKPLTWPHVHVLAYVSHLLYRSHCILLVLFFLPFLEPSPISLLRWVMRPRLCTIYQFIDCLDVFSILFFAPFLQVLSFTLQRRYFFHRGRRYISQRRYLHTTICNNCCNSWGLFYFKCEVRTVSSHVHPFTFSFPGFHLPFFAQVLLRLFWLYFFSVCLQLSKKYHTTNTLWHCFQILGKCVAQLGSGIIHVSLYSWIPFIVEMDYWLLFPAF